jgi:REP element-mobilizing transposase RayT
MPRLPRPQFPNAIYHVTSRGNRGEPIHEDPVDCRRFLTVLSQTIGRFGWQCFAYCLMTNHYHLVLVTPEPNISQGMHQLNGVYARWFNHRHGYEGHLFQRRFHSAVIESDWHLLEACRYVVLNPVRAGIVSGPSDWEWSSYRATVGASGSASTLAVDELLKFFGRRRNTAREAFRAFVADAPSRR